MNLTKLCIRVPLLYLILSKRVSESTAIIEQQEEEIANNEAAQVRKSDKAQNSDSLPSMYSEKIF